MVSRLRALGVALALATLGLAGCAQQPQQLAAAGHPKEYFPSSVYGRASPRVVADGQPIPHGGGQYLVGRPYTVAGETYYPSERRVTQIGLASWYGDAFHGRLTANGEVYDRNSFTAAHPTMPLPSYARVTNLRNNSSMIVRVNDRGPYHSNRIMDVSRRVADALDIRRTGTARVKVEWVARASLAGSDDAKLAATLRTDGPARLDGVEPTLVAAAPAPAPARLASLGAYEPSPKHDARMVDDERPERLEAYRAPRVLHRDEAHPRFRGEAKGEDGPREPWRHLPPHRLELRSATLAARAGPGLEPVPRPRAVEARRFAEREMTHAARDQRVESAPRAIPRLRHEATALEEHGLPPARPARLAAVLPPARPHAARLHGPRSHAD